MHHPISPAILYFGTPIILISTTNPDGTTNIAPMSSCWWLGHRAMLGLSSASQTTQNLLRTKQCVLNLPTEDMTSSINLLAKTTGTNPVPEWKNSVGYVHVKDKFSRAGLHPQESEMVDPKRILECPVQMEAELVVSHEMMGDMADKKGRLLALEVKILRIHVEDELRLEGYENRIDSEKLRLVFMAFQDFYGIRREKLGESRLAQIGEENYRGITKNDVPYDLKGNKVRESGEVVLSEKVGDSVGILRPQTEYLAGCL
jgi:flavin reductase (DIM6/NTAB) family NADH-FMN oxidoreductase RutF